MCVNDLRHDLNLRAIPHCMYESSSHASERHQQYVTCVCTVTSHTLTYHILLTSGQLESTASLLHDPASSQYLTLYCSIFCTYTTHHSFDFSVDLTSHTCTYHIFQSTCTTHHSFTSHTPVHFYIHVTYHIVRSHVTTHHSFTSSHLTFVTTSRYHIFVTSQLITASLRHTWSFSYHHLSRGFSHQLTHSQLHFLTHSLITSSHITTHHSFTSHTSHLTPHLSHHNSSQLHFSHLTSHTLTHHSSTSHTSLLTPHFSHHNPSQLPLLTPSFTHPL